MTSNTINVNMKRSNVILAKRSVCSGGQEYITDRIGDISYQISPVFLSSKSYADPEALCKGTGIRRSSRSETVWILSGSEPFPVPGTESKICPRWEIVPAAIENERKCKNLMVWRIQSSLGKAEEVLLREYKKMAFMQMSSP